MSDGRDGRRLDARDRIVFQPAARPDIATEVGNIDVGPLFGLPPVSILRPADFLALRFSFTNLQLTGSGDAPRHLVRRTANRAAYLTVEFPSQHITELALFETAAGIPVKTPEPPAGDTNAEHAPQERDANNSNDDPFPPGGIPVRSSISGPSRLVFKVTNESILYTLEGLLAACSTLPLNVVPHAPVAAVRRPVPWGAFLASSSIDLRFALSGTRSRGRRRAGARDASVTAFATAGQLAALSRSVATAARIEHRLGTEQALVVAAGSSIGDQIGASAVIDEMLNPGVIRIRPIPRAPRDTETALELPWRLQISPNPNGGFAHRTQAVEQAGRVELWHSRLGVRAVDGDVVEVDEDQKTYRTVRAIWTRDHDRFPFQPDPAPEGAFPNSNGQDDEPDYRMALNSRDRMLLVHETSNFGLTRQGDYWTPPAVDVDRLMLTSLGGWLSSQVMIPELPDGPFTIQEWKHRATMARDHEVKVVYAGFLWPFGHKASLVKVTERKFAPTQPGNPAYLFQRMFIIVREPTRTYTDARVDDDSGKRLDLVMPFKSVTFVTRVTPNLDEPDKLKRFGTNTAFGGGAVFFPEVDSSPFLFKVLAVDVEGNVIEYGGPMLFIERDHNVPGAGADALKKIDEAYIAANDQFIRHDLGGQKVAFAKGAKPDDTTLQTKALYWEGLFPTFYGSLAQDDTRWAPALKTAEVVVPAMNALAGNNTPTKVAYPDHYSKNGFDPHAEVFLEITKATKLDFSGQSDRSGGFVTPNLSLTGLSRMRGPIGGNIDNTANGTADPADFFAGIKAKLFGVVPLPELLKAIGFDPSKFPTFASQALNRVSALTQDLERLQQMAVDLATQYAGTADAQVQAVVNALGPIGTAAADVLDGIGDLFDGTDPAPPLSDRVDAVAGQLGALAGAIDAATLLPSAVRNDIAGLVRRVQDQVGDAAGNVALIEDLVDAIEQFVGGLELPEVVTARIGWSIDLNPWPSGAAIFQPTPAQGQALADARSKLELAVELQAPTKAGAEPTALVSCGFTPFQLRLIGDDAFIILHFEKIEFLLAPGKKPDVNVVFKEDNGIEFAGPLSFVNTLKEIIPFDGFSDPPYLDVTADGIKAGFDLGLPTLSVGVFSLANISLGAHVRVPFLDESLDVGFNFCTRENPFRLTVWLFGGGGFFGITITPEKCRVLEAAFEFGAAVALDFGVASGSIECMAGVYFRIEDGDASLTGYFRLRGEVDVLGLISACIELYLELTYEFSSGKATGRATLTIEVEVLFLSFSVEISCEKKFKGSNNDPDFVQIMGAPPGDPRPWDEYCFAFADQ